MVNLAAMLTNAQKSSPEPLGQFSQTWYVYLGLQPIVVFSNDSPRNDLGQFYGKVSFGNIGCTLEKVKTMDILEIIAACDLKVGKRRQLVKVCN